MSGQYIFTKRFANLPPNDQAAVVDSAIRDLEMALGQACQGDRGRIRRAIKRIKGKAIQYGVYEEEVNHG